MSVPPDLLAEARRQLEVCNSCRYCEGYCAVFPALERKSQVSNGDVMFLANLCHDCRACYQACPYTPPHELAINLPAVLSQARVAAYSRYAWPKRFAGLITNSMIATFLLTIAGLALALLAIALSGNIGRFGAVDDQPGSFYRIVPYLVLLTSTLAATTYIVLVIGLGAWRFWTEVWTARPGNSRDWPAWASAVRDVAVMTNLQGGGGDCYQPDPLRASPWRRVLHQAVLYGFGLAFVATVLAAVAQDVLGIDPPYAWLSPPVITGAVGGTLMIVGTTGLFFLKAQSLRRARALLSSEMLSLDNAFIVVLDFVSITGMLTLALRNTGALALMLTLHLAGLVALYFTAPYGKFVHGVYRFLALVKNRAEQRSEHSESVTV